MNAQTLNCHSYLRCPQCRELMNRLNFANCSGIIVDACRPHGTWFDLHELHRIVQFIRSGGMTRSRARQIADLAAERRRVQAARVSGDTPPTTGAWTADADLFGTVISAAGEILGAWIDSP